MADKGLEIVAVAQDSGGEAAAGPFYDRAKATYATLLDPMHTVTSLYAMVNVPSGVWIDEQGMIVRPPEVAYSKPYDFGGLKVGDDRYVAGLRDWVKNGAASPFVMSKEMLAEKLEAQSNERPLADAHFKLAVFLYRRGDEEEAAVHWQEAQELDPWNWNYHRQEWTFDPTTTSENWLKKFQELNGRPYYEPADLPDGR